MLTLGKGWQPIDLIYDPAPKQKKPRIRKNAWLPEQEDRLRELHGQGLTLDVIAVKMGRTCQSIKMRCFHLRLLESRKSSYSIKKWTKGEISKMIQMLKEGKSMQELSAVLGREPGRIKDKAARLRRAGMNVPRLQPPRTPWTKHQIEIMIKMAHAGHPAAAVAEKLGMHRDSVYHKAYRLRLQGRDIPLMAPR